jgi:hypothetical protein
MASFTLSILDVCVLKIKNYDYFCPHFKYIYILYICSSLLVLLLFFSIYTIYGIIYSTIIVKALNKIVHTYLEFRILLLLIDLYLVQYKTYWCICSQFFLPIVNEQIKLTFLYEWLSMYFIWSKWIEEK